MKTQRFFGICIVLGLVTLPAFAQVSDPWQRAVEHFSNSLDLYPGEVVTHFELRNGKGETEEVTVTTSRVHEDAQGEITSVIEKVIFNGKDVTEEAIEKQKDDNIDFSKTSSLFHPENQDQISKTVLPEKRSIDNKICVGYEYSQKLEKETRNGTVWINKETGIPVENVFTPDPLPKHAKTLENHVTFSYNPDGSFYVDRVRVQGEGGMLFIKKQFRMDMTFKQYWKKEPR